MNDLQQLTLTLEHLGIEYKLEPRGSDPYLDEEYGESTITQSVTIGNGVGYSFFYHEFYFDKDGKFVTHGAWE